MEQTLEQKIDFFNRLGSVGIHKSQTDMLNQFCRHCEDNNIKTQVLTTDWWVFIERV